MCYKIDGEPDRKFYKIDTARKSAIEQFSYHRDMGNHNPVIRIYLCNMVGGIEIGKVKKGPGYPIYINKDGDVFRLSKNGKARRE